jgi:hypothetical protein
MADRCDLTAPVTDDTLLAVIASADPPEAWDAYHQSMRDWRARYEVWQREHDDRVREDIAENLGQAIGLIGLRARAEGELT